MNASVLYQSVLLYQSLCIYVYVILLSSVFLYDSLVMYQYLFFFSLLSTLLSFYFTLEFVFSRCIFCLTWYFFYSFPCVHDSSFYVRSLILLIPYLRFFFVCFFWSFAGFFFLFPCFVIISFIAFIYCYWRLCFLM